MMSMQAHATNINDTLTGDCEATVRPRMQCLSTPERDKTGPRYQKLRTTALYMSNANGWDGGEIRMKLFFESIGSFVGYMDPKEFVKLFLSWQTRRPEHMSAFEGVFPAFRIEKAKTAAHRYFVNVRNGLHLKNVQFVETHDFTESSSTTPKNKPNLAVYRKQCSLTGSDYDPMELWIEAKYPKKLVDPFKDPALLQRLAKGSDENANTVYAIGELVFHVASQVDSTLRTHCFSVLLSGDQAHLTRWDRAGAIITEAFDFVNEPLLVEFFKRFDQLTQEQRGWDTSIRTPSDDDRLVAKAMLEPKQSVVESEESFERRKREFDSTTFLEYSVPNPDGDDKLPIRFIVPLPTRVPLSLQGRSSREYAVYDMQNKHVYYLKDTRQFNSSGCEQEGETYKTLHEEKVAHIAIVIAHGDVVLAGKGSKEAPMNSIRMTRRSANTAVGLDQRSVSQSKSNCSNNHMTLTEEFCDRSWGTYKLQEQPLYGYIHYRLVLNVVGRGQASFGSTKEVVQVFTLKAHWQAYSKARILHRDDSIGNLMIKEDGRELLVDWNLAKDVKMPFIRSSGRTGTREFISAGLLMYPEKLHIYVDDLESFLHMLFFTLLRFCGTNYNLAQLRLLVDKIFNEVISVDNSGGREKAVTLCFVKDYVPFNLTFAGRRRLASHLRSIARFFEDLYTLSVPEVDAEEDYVAPRRFDINPETVERLERDGFSQFKDALQGMLKLSKDWINDVAANVVQISDSPQRAYVQELLEQMGSAATRI